MPMLPIRGVGDIGVITDVRPYDLPLTAWANARNVRFRNKRISKYSIFKKMNTPISFTDTPIYAVDASVSGVESCIVGVQADGLLKQIQGGVQSDVSPTVAWGTVAGRVTSARLGGVTYLNNSAGGLLYRNNPASPLFAKVPALPASDVARAVRVYRDYVVMLNVKKGAIDYPNMVKWSDVVQAGAPPPNWDVTSLSSHAGENVINDSSGELVDGLTLGNTFILYGSQETYRMSFIGTPLIFAIEKLFDDLGVLGPDCAAEIDGKHYVFGTDQIYMHDGVQKISLSEGKVTERIFSSIDFGRRAECFVFQNSIHSEVLFCYPSINDDAAWNGADTNGCNEAAVFNYKTGVWTFIDLPGVTHTLLASFPTSLLWSDLLTWDVTAATWRSFEGTEPKLPIMISAGNIALSHDPELYFLDNHYDGFLSNEIESRLLFSGYISTSIKDTDDMGGSLASTKLISSIVPQVAGFTSASYLDVYVGWSRSATMDVNWSPPTSFNPENDYKCDFRVTGRYIAMKFVWPSSQDAVLSGFDLNVSILAER